MCRYLVKVLINPNVYTTKKKKKRKTHEARVDIDRHREQFSIRR